MSYSRFAYFSPSISSSNPGPGDVRSHECVVFYRSGIFWFLLFNQLDVSRRCFELRGGSWNYSRGKWKLFHCTYIKEPLLIPYCYRQERRKDLIDHRDDSTFSFDPASLNVKQLSKQQRKKLDARKGVLLASYSRKKTRRRKKGKEGADNGNNVVSLCQFKQI